MKIKFRDYCLNSDDKLLTDLVLITNCQAISSHHKR